MTQSRTSNSSMEDAGQSTVVQAAPVRSAQHARRKSLRLQESAALPAGHAAPDHRARLDALGDQLEQAMSNVDAATAPLYAHFGWK